MLHRFLLCSLLILLSTLSSRSIAQVNFAGYLKNFTIAQDEFDSGPIQLDETYRMQNFGRFMLDAFNDNQVWQLHYEVGVDSTSELQNFGQSNLTPQRNSYRLTDIDSSIGPDNRKNPF